MKPLNPALALLFFLIFSHGIYAQPCNMLGVYKVGPTGNYLTITAALTALKANGVANNVFLELQPTYTSTGETFPLTFNGISCLDNSKTVTIRPETGATELIITSNLSTIVDLNNSRYIHFDGRPGGTGTIRGLTISSPFNTVVQFRNDASFNSFSYVNIAGGGVLFGTSNLSITNGNNANIIQNCAVYNATTVITNCIRSLGSPGKKNSNNKVLNNFIYNATNGVSLEANSSAWDISGNHIYNTTGTVVTATGISINDTTSSGFQVHNNFIGGSAPNCGGSPNTFNSFTGIRVLAHNATYNSIQGNTVANIKVTANWQAHYFAGISMHRGKFKCGDQTGNTIGSQTTTGSIIVRGEDDYRFFGIVAGDNDFVGGGGVDTCYIMNNKIGGFHGYQADFNFSQSNLLAGIYLKSQQSGFADVSNNIIGSPTVYYSMSHMIDFSEQRTFGIFDDKGYQTWYPDNKISNNEIANMAGGAVGIFSQNGKPKILNNTIHHLYGHETLDYTGSPVGIAIQQAMAGSIVSGNTIHSLTWTGQSFSLSGIYYSLSRGIIIEKNFIHSFQATSSTSGYLNGIISADNTNGKERIQNNMIRLGIDTAGNSVSNATIHGISIKPDSSIVTNNSVFVGGSGNWESAAMRIREVTTNSNSKIRNNIFANTRSTTASTFFNHYALKYEGGFITSNDINYNNYYSSGTGGYLAFLTVVPFQPIHNNFTNIVDWRNASKQDSNSFFYQPNFISPTGNSSTVNLHLGNPNPAEGQGVADIEVIDDIDNQIRASLSPVDIGADAGNFTYQDGDAPRITHRVFLGNPVPTSFVYTVKITDNGSGVDTVGNNKPRMWFRKKYPSISNWSSLPGNLVSGNLNDGVWGFIPDFAGAGVPVSTGDSLEYYFVAQDKGPIANTGYSNIAGCVHTSVNTQTSPPTTPLRLLIYGIFSDTVYVGTGQQFTSLTNENGFFHTAKFHMFDTTSANPTVIITSDLSESGTHEYTNINESGARIKFVTNTAVVKQIRNLPNILKPLITFRNVKNITLDGSVNGSGRYFHFISGNTNRVFTTPPLSVYGGGRGLTIRNSIFESNGITNAAPSVEFYGNDLDTLLIENNIFKNIETSANGTVGLPNTGLYLSAFKSHKIIVRKNEFTNFGQTGLLVTQSIFNPTGEILVDSNHVYYNSSIEPINGRTGLDVQVNIKITITNNFIGGSQPYCGGNPWTYNLQSTANNAVFRGIVVSGPLYLTSSVQNNTIQNIRILNWGLNLIGIQGNGGTLHIGTEQPNTIGSLAGDSSIVNKNHSTAIYGRVALFTNDTPYVRIENNIMAGLTAAYVEGINFETKRGFIKNNLVQNLYASGSTLGIPGFKGIRLWLDNGVIEGNRISNLVATQETFAGWVYGMDLATTGPAPNRILIARNKIDGLQSYWNGGSGSQSIIGLRHQFGQYTLQNNEINITNGSLTNPVDIKGLFMEGSTSNTFQSKIYYNTIRVGGSSSANVNTYAVLFTGGSPVKFFRNNVLYNERTGGTGKHLAIGDLSTSSPPVFVPVSGNNNLYIVTDTNYVNEYHATGAVNIRQWRNLTQSDTASYAARVMDVPADSLFVSPATGNLNVNTASPRSWYLNGKGLPIDSISGDYDLPAGVRSTTIAGGATDIGADEFNTSTSPPALIVSGNRVPGGTETFIVNGRVIASITWGNTGTLPTLGEPLFYSGVWPNDTTNNGTAHFARFMNAFWSIPATGGSNYTYSITFYYDSSMLGKVTNPSTMVVNKRQTGVAGSWDVIQPTIVNTALKTITINNQSSFSEFTATDADATLETGVASPDLVIIDPGLTGTPSTGSTITAHFSEFNQGTAAAPVNKVQFYLSADNNLTPGANGDTLLGEYEVTNLLAINTGTGPLTKQLVIPCNLLPGIYYMFFVADGGNVVQESDENNNNAILNVQVTVGLTLPSTPVITASPGSTVCGPQTVTLTANSSGCTNCTYSWSTGATVNSITVNASGTYTVTVTNSCGQSSSSQQVTVNTTPNLSLNISPNTSAVCLNTPVTLTASGATSYSWSGNGLNTTSGSVVIANPNAAATYLYMVIGTSNGCPDTLITSVTFMASPSVTIAQNDTSICNGSSIQISASGAASYQWSPSNGLNATNLATVTATPVTTTTYTVTGTNAAGCLASDMIIVSVLPAVAPSVSVTYSGCPSSTLNFMATSANGGSNPQYQWFVNNVAAGTGPSFILNNATNNSRVRCTLTSGVTCAVPQTVSDSVMINCITTAVPNIDGVEDFFVAPIPARDKITVYLKLNTIKKISFTLFDINGKKLYQSNPFHSAGSVSQQLELGKYSSGVYLLKIYIGNQSITNKIIKTN